MLWGGTALRWENPQLLDALARALQLDRVPAID
jgi:hypothetical protein